MPSRGRIISIIVSFATIFVLATLLLSLFPFYPLYVTLGIALVLGIVAIELPGLAVLVSVLLSVLAAMYQNAFMGMIFLFVLVLLSSFISGSFDLVMVSASWVIAFFASPYLAILPTVLAGYRDSRQDAVRVGAVSGISIFLLSWMKGISQGGLMFVPSPSSYLPIPIPNPWQFQAFVPSAAIFSANALSAYFAPLISSIGDFRIYAFILGWAVAAFLVAFLAPKWKGYVSIAASVVGVLPLLVLSLVFARSSALQVGVALVGTVVASAGYTAVRPLVTAPTLPTFKTLEDLSTTGIPRKYSILLGSPACDERNMVVEQFIQSSLGQKVPSFMVTSDVSFAESAAKQFGEILTVLVANPRATAAGKNVIPLTTGVQNLTSLNIELVKLVRDRAGSGARIILDVVSEVMLAQKMLTTRRWVSDLNPRFDNWGFTVLGVFNPGLHSSDEVQGLIELFNAYVQIYEKEIGGRTRKLITVRKMADLQYREGDLVIEREQLARKKGGMPTLRHRLGR
jgi:hypothetical protein